MEKSTGRKTWQLEVVWQEVAGDNSHPTADQIYKWCRGVTWIGRSTSIRW